MNLYDYYFEMFLELHVQTPHTPPILRTVKRHVKGSGGFHYEHPLFGHRQLSVQDAKRMCEYGWCRIFPVDESTEYLTELPEGRELARAQWRKEFAR